MTDAKVNPSFRISDDAAVLADIYCDDINVVIWQRQLGKSVQEATKTILERYKTLKVACTVGVEDCFETLYKELGKTETARILAADIQALTEMFCCLFDLKRVAIRVTKLDRAMCPKFHVDRVPARLITTYYGNGTQWLQNESVDRSKLGIASVGILDEKSGVYDQASNISNMSAGEVALLKGESWLGNENRGIVHRSPPVPENEQRLIMTFDFTDDEDES